MRFLILTFLVLLTSACSNSKNNKTTIEMTDEELLTPFDKNKNTTATYSEAIEYYKKLSKHFPQLQLKEYGSTDSGFPLHLAILSKEKDFDSKTIRQKGKQVLMVNNAIHAGEPCGVDASMLIAKDYLTKTELQEFLQHTVILFIPVYNIGGALNRNSTTRANQNGPESYGFRGNAQNLDLNRDFIKCDSKNAQTINQIFAEWQPDVLIDNHTSNGADYQYTITLIATQHNKLNPHLANYLNNNMLPRLYKDMKTANWEMTPYVNARSTPDEGIAGFLDLARYSSGYAALFNTISFMPETHMLKPFEGRVRSTYAFMDAMIKLMHDDKIKIAQARQKAIEQTKTQSDFDLNWILDFDVEEKILFKGYEAKYKDSEVSGQPRLYYDRDVPFEKEIPFYNTYKTSLTVKKPIAYIIPQAYSKVTERLKWNDVEIKRLTQDQEIEVELYRIDDYETSKLAYEGHYLHSQTKVKASTRNWQFHKGDYVVYVNQPVNRYIVETLEPQAPDSYFAWNLFDGILMQKEYFSSYVFEDLAAKYLTEHPDLKNQLEQRISEDPEFAKSARAQLAFVYENSPWHEKTHQVYPVGRLLKDIDLVLE